MAKRIVLEFTDADYASFVTAAEASQPIPEDDTGNPLFTPGEWLEEFWRRAIIDHEARYTQKIGRNAIPFSRRQDAVTIVTSVQPIG